MEMPSIDRTKIYIVTDAGSGVSVFEREDANTAMIEFGHSFVEAWGKANTGLPVKIIPNPDPKSRGGFEDCIVAYSGPELLVMAYGVSMEVWDEYGAGTDEIDVGTLTAMTMTYREIEKMKLRGDNESIIELLNAVKDALEDEKKVVH